MTLHVNVLFYQVMLALCCGSTNDGGATLTAVPVGLSASGNTITVRLRVFCLGIVRIDGYGVRMIAHALLRCSSRRPCPRQKSASLRHGAAAVALVPSRSVLCRLR